MKFASRAQIWTVVEGESILRRYVRDDWCVPRLCYSKIAVQNTPAVLVFNVRDNPVDAKVIQRTLIPGERWLIFQIKNVPLEFTYSEETYELQGAQCYGSLSQGMTGDGHYTAVCVCDGQLVLFNDLVESRDACLANKWLERCSLLVYASTYITMEYHFCLTFNE